MSLTFSLLRIVRDLKRYFNTIWVTPPRFSRHFHCATVSAFQVTCHEKDPSWLNDHIKRLIKQKNKIFKKYLKDGRANSDCENLQTILLKKNKKKTVTMNVLLINLTNRTTSSKTYWSIVKTLVNGKRVPDILLILAHNTLVICFKERTNIWKIYSVNKVNL